MDLLISASRGQSDVHLKALLLKTRYFEELLLVYELEFSKFRDEAIYPVKSTSKLTNKSPARRTQRKPTF